MGLRIGTELPSFEGATDWVNSDAESIELSGSPVLVHFWSVSCGLCKDNLPKVAEIRDQRRNQGLKVVAVHMPRYPEDLNREAVNEAIGQYQITEPCAIDDGHKLRDAFGNDRGYVPAYYVFDAEGRLKGFAAGANGLKLVLPALDRVLNSSKTAA
jgi:thiol-disulfide isomerase/thioredoxin